jgi:hypothetical protein
VHPHGASGSAAAGGQEAWDGFEADRAVAKSAEGRRLRQVFIDDRNTALEPGDEGTVSWVDDAGTVNVDWDRGPDLALLAGVDVWEWI